MTIAALLQWWNLIFVLPFLAAVGYVLLMATGAVAAESFGDADIDLDADVDADVDADIDIDGDHHLDIEGAGEGGFWSYALTVLGVGKAPLSIVVTCFCFAWGFTGWASNELFRSFLPAPTLFVWASLAVALVASVLFTRLFVLGLTKILPLDENYAVSDAQLVGRRAKARYSITFVSGTAQVYDQYGTLHEVACRLKSNGSKSESENGDNEVLSLPPGTPIVLLDYDHKKKLFYVRLDPLENRLEGDQVKRALP